MHATHPATSLAIRRATQDDVPAISRLLASLAHRCTVHPDGLGAERFLEGIGPGAVAGFIASPAYHYLVGEADGELAAVIALRDNSHLFHLFVDARFQQRGFASILWAHLRQHALDNGNPGEFTIRQLAELVIELTGSGSKLVFRPLPEDDPLQRRPDIGKAKALLDWQPTVPLKEGLTRTIAYFDRFLQKNAMPAVG